MYYVLTIKILIISYVYFIMIYEIIMKVKIWKKTMSPGRFAGLSPGADTADGRHLPQGGGVPGTVRQDHHWQARGLHHQVRGYPRTGWAFWQQCYGHINRSIFLKWFGHDWFA